MVVMVAKTTAEECVGSYLWATTWCWRVSKLEWSSRRDYFCMIPAAYVATRIPKLDGEYHS